MQRLRWFIAGAVCVLLLFFLFGRMKEKSLLEHQEPEGHAELEGHAEHEGHDEHGEEQATITLGVEAQNLIGLQTVPVEEAVLERRIPVVGEIAQDPERIEHVVSPEAGVIVELKAAEGARVERGEVLAVVRPSGVETSIEIKSSLSGVVLAGHVQEGDRVDTITSIYTVADLSRLPANFNVYEKDVGQVEVGQRMIIRSIAYPAKTFNGRITFISPRVEEETHTIRIRAVVENPDYMLKLGMFVNGEIVYEEDLVSPVIPSSAIYVLEGRKGVFVKTGESEFEPRFITVGEETDTTVSVISGLRKGESVVSDNAFLLKSELLKAKLGAGCAE